MLHQFIPFSAKWRVEMIVSSLRMYSGEFDVIILTFAKMHLS